MDRVGGVCGEGGGGEFAPGMKAGVETTTENAGQQQGRTLAAFLFCSFLDLGGGGGGVGSGQPVCGLFGK